MNKRFSFKKLIACLLLLAMLPVTAFAACKITVPAKNIKVYSKNSTTAAKLGTLTKGASISTSSVSGEFCQITFDKKTGYVRAKDLVTSKTNYYTTREAKVYTKATSSSKVLDTLSADFPLYVIGKSGSYSLVTSTDYKACGYVRTSYLKTTKTEPFKVADTYKSNTKADGGKISMPSAVKSSQSYVAKSMTKSKYIEYILYAAQSKLGCKYSASPNNKTTFSNASFVRASFAVMDYTVAKKVKDIGHSGKAAYIARKNLKRGDIVCFECDTADKEIVDHVGIYLGSGYFIHASMTADRVIVSNMSSGYYYKAFCWGRRIVS